ncbi:MAG: PKD domain-containing protein [Bacteroidia bacterium]
MRRCPDSRSTTGWYSTYNWSVPAGATITSGQGTNSVTVDWGASGGTLSVTETNACGPGLPVSINVSTSSTPVTSSITGQSPVCPNTTGIIYTVVNTTGSTYNWSVPAGAVITAGQGTNSITVDWGATGGTISVTETSTCGTGAPVTTTIVVSSTPLTSAITGTSPVCPNASATSYSVTNTSGSTYNWTIPAGATLTSGQGTNMIVVDWGSTGGSLSVTETSACGSGTPVTFTVVMNSLPITSAIAGPTPVCPNATGTIYNVSNTAGSVYNWTVPAGATITSGQGTNSITVNWGSTGGNISVTETNSCGNGSAVTMNVAIITAPVASAIFGPNLVCPNAMGMGYSMSITNPGSTYNWTIPPGATMVSGQGTSIITVNWGTTGGTIFCTETYACGSLPPSSINISIGTSPNTSPISGTSPVCQNATAITYSVTNTAGSTYNWTIPAGATLISGQGTNLITVNWGATGGSISVTETNTCGNGTAVSFTVVVNTLPATTPINGSPTVCPNSTNVIYSTNNTAGSTYNWTVPAGAAIISGQGNNAVIVNWGTTAGTVSVTETNACGVGTPVTYPVTFFPLPSTSPITGGNPSCANTNGVAYTVTNTPGSTYNWSVTGGGTIVSGQGTNSMSLNWGATGGTVTVVETNSCGPGAPVSVNVTFSTIPVTSVITGVSPVCPNQASVLYSVTGNAGSAYNWTVPAGATIVSGSGSNTITVNWGATGGVITCTESNICGTGTAQSTTVAMNAAPATSTITGTTPLCPNAGGVIFSVANTSGSTYSWNVPSGSTIISGQGSNSISVNWGIGGGNVSVTETNTCGNGAPVNFAVSMNPSPVVQLNASIHQGCSPLTVNFTDNSLTGGGATITSWSWIFGDGNASTLQNPSNTYASPGAYNVTLTVTSGAGCTLSYTASNLINVFPDPSADFTTADPFVTITDPTVSFIDLSQSNIISWNWSFGDTGSSSQQNPSHFYNDAGLYTVILTVTNQYGCMDDITKTVEVKDEFTFYIPNAFTPNGDGHNDAFRGEGRGIGKYEMLIFDRWGELIYKTNEYDKPWNGIAKKGQDEVQEDVYIYKITVNEEDGGKEHKYIGQVSIVH